MGLRNELPLTVEYISTACNRSPLCADWNSQNILCFGACNSIALLDTEYNDGAKITHTLVNHKASVNSVRWIRSSETNENDSIISGSSDGTAVIWKYIDTKYCLVHCLREHKGSVTVVDARYIKEDNNSFLYAVTASIDSCVKIWKENFDEMICFQTIQLNNGLCLVLQLHTLPNTNTPILALGLDDNKIHLYVETTDNSYEKKFIKVISLRGHEDWIRGLDFITLNDKLMLATCSQDTYIRLWSMEIFKEREILDDKLEIKKEYFTVDDNKWSVSLDTILSGHEGWVYGVHWNNCKSLKLLSASIDKSLIIWEPNIVDGTEGVWSESIRVGEVGGSGLGFYGGKFSSNGEAIIGHGYTGSFHLWKYKKELSSWEPSVVSGGHFGGVLDICWDPDGDYLLSASIDQTVRIHSPWINKNTSHSTWHEIARPQIHGFDMSSLAIISKYIYASGAEEKVIRTFHAPKNFIENFYNLTGHSSSAVLNDVCEGASISSLGLSNKAVYNIEDISEQKHVKDQYPTHYFVPVKLKEPPTEETLMQNTLWPETHKLYGHGYEIFTLAASPDGKILASACKATTTQHASIILWDTNSWTQKQSLASHNLTVVQLAFSPNSLMLLSVSRDRRWSVFQKCNDETFTLIGCSDKSNGIHTRIIWCCAWTHDSKYFLTGSRDGKIVVWGKEDTNVCSKSTGAFSSSIPPLELKDQSVTALATSPKGNGIIVSVGMETGLISLYQLCITTKSWQLLFSLDNNIAHHLTVKRLWFRPKKDITENDTLQLASCSEDHMVKIYNMSIHVLT